jgi:ABC-2 type transport system permease protein
VSPTRLGRATRINAGIGTWPWLLAHEVRLRWRELGNFWWIAPSIILLIAVGFVGAISGAGLSWNGDLSSEQLFFLFDTLLFVFTTMLATSINASIRVLFTRGDLDLLVSSPIASRTVFASRAAALVLELFLASAALLGIIPIIIAVLGGWRWLSAFPTLLAMAIMATSLGLLVTLGLVRTIGVRRATVLTQVVSSVIGASFYLAFQAPSLLRNTPYGERIGQGLAALTASFRSLKLDAPQMFAARAVTGSPLDLGLMLAVSVLALYATVQFTHRWFMLGNQEARVVVNRKPTRRARAIRFRGGLWRAMLLKEWRLILRDPALVSRTLMQILYVLPGALVIVGLGGGNKNKGLELGPILAVSAALTGGSLASGLVRMTVAAEDAPELLAGAPLPRGVIRPIKLLAGLIPALLMTSPLVLAGFLQDAGHGWFVLLTLVGSTVSFGMTTLWMAQPISRSDLYRRARADNDMLLDILSGILLLAWTGVGVQLPSGHWIGWTCLAVAVVIPAAIYVLTRGRHSSLGYG